MLSKWRIKGLDNYVIGEDKSLYRLPFESNRKYYGLRKLKVIYPNRYYIEGKIVSKRQLKHRIYLDPEPILLYKTEETPF